MALVENSQRVDVHPYEEAQGFQRLLDLPGYDVAALVEKSGKSASHIYARLSLLQLIPTIAEAFTAERLTASHANLLARLPQEAQATAYEQCWRKDWQDREPHLLPARHVGAWIKANLYLALADAPFDIEDATLNPVAGARTTCPRRSGYNTSLFEDVEGDQCLDSPCYQAKVAAHIDRTVATTPGLIQIENGYRPAKEKVPGAVQRGHFREIVPTIVNPEAEPVAPCAAVRPALIVYGRKIGTSLTVCTDEDCSIHDPLAEKKRQAAEREADGTSLPPSIEPTIEETQQQEERRKERERRKEEERVADEQQQEEYGAQQRQRAELQQARNATFERIVADAPATFTAAQMRIFLRALVNLDSHTFAQDVAEHFAGEEMDKSPETILLDIIDGLADHHLTGLALRLALAGHTGIPRESEIDLLAEADIAFAPPAPAKATSARTEKKPTPIKRPAKKQTAKSKKKAA